MKEEIVYLWRTKSLGRWRTTRFKATEDFIRREHPEAVPLEHTREVRMVPETEEELMQRMRDGSFVARCHPERGD